MKLWLGMNKVDRFPENQRIFTQLHIKNTYNCSNNLVKKGVNDKILHCAQKSTLRYLQHKLEIVYVGLILKSDT